MKCYFNCLPYSYVRSARAKDFIFRISNLSGSNFIGIEYYKWFAPRALVRHSCGGNRHMKKNRTGHISRGQLQIQALHEHFNNKHE